MNRSPKDVVLKGSRASETYMPPWAKEGHGGLGLQSRESKSPAGESRCALTRGLPGHAGQFFQINSYPW